jgi:predicted protein tyrosine phosphatase
MKNFWVYSRYLIEATEAHDVSHVIISITTNSSDQAKLRVNELTAGVLRLSFYDFDAAVHVNSDTIEGIDEDMLFSDAQAKQIAEFVFDHRDVERFIVHCDAGRSRSPGVAAAVCKIITGDDKEFFDRYKPNMRVYRKTLNACNDIFNKE